LITLAEKVKDLLDGLNAPVFYFYPMAWDKLPAVSWRESGNRELAQADGREHLAELTYAIDIWGDSPGENMALFARIDEQMASARFRRDYMEDLFDANTGRHHRTIRYRAVADGEGNIYQ